MCLFEQTTTAHSRKKATLMLSIFLPISMMLLVIATLWPQIAHSAGIGYPGTSDAARGFLFGIPIGIDLVCVRKMIWMRRKDAV